MLGSGLCRLTRKNRWNKWNKLTKWNKWNELNNLSVANLTSYVRYNKQWIEWKEYKKMLENGVITSEETFQNQRYEHPVITPVKTNINKMIRREFSTSSSLYDERLIKNLEEKSTGHLSTLENILKYIRGVPLIPFIFPAFTLVEKNHVGLIFRFGKPNGYRTEGLGVVYPFYKKIIYFCGDMTINNDNMRITDSNKNPLIISTHVIYSITDPINNYINLKSNTRKIENASKEDEDKDIIEIEGDYVFRNWLESLVRREICKYSYDELTDAELIQIIKEDIKDVINLNEGSEKYGICVKDFGINEISYTP